MLPSGAWTAGVVICAYTEARWSDLCAAVTSLRHQTRPPDEIVVVVDHNPGLLARAGSLSGARAVASLGPVGLSGARNTGVRESRSDIVLFLDDDAVAEPEWVERTLAAFLDPQVIGVGGWVDPVWAAPGRPGWFPEPFLWVVGCSYSGLPTARADVRNPLGAAMAFRRRAFELTGGFSTEVGRTGEVPTGCEETEFAITVRQADPAARIVIEPAARVRHRVTAARRRPGYFVRRCWHEGRSKRVVAAAVGGDDALSSERGYVTRVLPVALLEGVASTLRTGRLSGASRALAILIGLVVTAAGYALPPARPGARRWFGRFGPRRGSPSA